MSFRALAWAVDQKVSSPAAKLVLIILANYADDKGECYPSQETLAADTSMSDRTVRTAIAFLRDAGLIVVEPRPGTGGGRNANKYRLRQPEKSAACQGGQPEKSGGATGKYFRGQPENISEEPIKRNLSLEPTTHLGLVFLKPFPDSGTVWYTPWAELIRKVAPGIDPDLVAEPFRRFCQTKSIAYDDKRLPKSLATYASKFAKDAA